MDGMDQVLGLRPFVPARDFGPSKSFYKGLGFLSTYEDESVAIFKLEDFSFILQDFFVEELANNLMVQLLVRDADAWWGENKVGTLAARFPVREPRAPTMQAWGLKVGFLFDPSGVLWHVAELPS